jgi:hypothetical protein
MDFAALETAIVSAVTSVIATYGVKSILEQRGRLKAAAERFTYVGSFQTGTINVAAPPVQVSGEVATRQLSTPARIPAGHRQFLPAKTSKELQDDFKKREEDSPIPRASRWTRASPSKRYAVFYVGTLVIAIFTLLLITGRLPLR